MGNYSSTVIPSAAVDDTKEVVMTTIKKGEIVYVDLVNKKPCDDGLGKDDVLQWVFADTDAKTLIETYSHMFESNKTVSHGRVLTDPVMIELLKRKMDAAGHGLGVLDFETYLGLIQEKAEQLKKAEESKK